MQDVAERAGPCRDASGDSIFGVTLAIGGSRSQGRSTWEDVCQLWGMDIIRERTVFVVEGRGSGHVNDTIMGLASIPVEGSDSIAPAGGSVQKVKEHFVVSRVRPHRVGALSPALNAGLRDGDAIISINGKPDPSPKELYLLLKDTFKIDVVLRRTKSEEKKDGTKHEGQSPIKDKTNEAVHFDQSKRNKDGTEANGIYCSSRGTISSSEASGIEERIEDTEESALLQMLADNIDRSEISVKNFRPSDCDNSDVSISNEEGSTAGTNTNAKTKARNDACEDNKAHLKKSRKIISAEKPANAVRPRGVSLSYAAGPGMSKSTKLKRLWPDAFVFRKRVMKWCPPCAVIQSGGRIRFQGNLRPNEGEGLRRKATSTGTGNEGGLSPIPSSIHSVSEMLKVMSPHILAEGRAQINNDFEENSCHDGFWSREVFQLTLSALTPVERQSSSSSKQRVFEFGFDGPSSTVLDRIPQNVDDLFVLYSQLWSGGVCIGMVGFNDHNTVYLEDQRNHDNNSQKLFRLWVTASKGSCGRTGWLAQSDVPKLIPGGGVMPQSVHVMYIGSATNIIRQYEGMKSLAFVNSHLQRAVFCENLTRKSNPINTSKNQTASKTEVEKPSTVPHFVWHATKSCLNHVQLHAISKIMEGKSKENISLIQGPPGTGKTVTICHLVSFLLNGACPKPGSKMSGVKIHVGRSISSVAVGNGEKSDLKHNRASNRVLVCAASNAAVDELAWKIHKFSIGVDGKRGGLSMVRYGFLPGDGHDRYHTRREFLKREKPLAGIMERNKFLRDINYDVKAVSMIGKERKKVLSRAHVVCATLSGVGSKTFVDAVASDDRNLGSEFDLVIIDEACQATEASCLIPLKFNPKLVVLVGDPQQLPAFVASQSSEKGLLGRSLFERLQENGWPVDMLCTQYRMHQSIVSFPSIFYRNKLLTADEVKQRPPAPWHVHMLFPPLLVWNMDQSAMQRSSSGGLSNRSEARFVCKIVSTFIGELGKSFASQYVIKIGIISFYSTQVTLLKKLLPTGDMGKISVEVSTVDGFQGKEVDIIILSCVRSFHEGRGRRYGTSLGFLQDFRRVNVALTRARESLWIVGNCNTLTQDKIWANMLDSAQKSNVIAKASDFERLLVSYGTERAQAQSRRFISKTGRASFSHGTTRAKRQKWNERKGG